MLIAGSFPGLQCHGSEAGHSRSMLSAMRFTLASGTPCVLRAWVLA